MPGQSLSFLRNHSLVGSAPRRWFRSAVRSDAADACTGSLCCESAEEAKTLIPSLASKISDDDLQELLDNITQFRNLVD